jgi:hypothetical protein
MIEDAFWDDEVISEERSIFENLRRETVDQLFAMPAKD